MRCDGMLIRLVSTLHPRPVPTALAGTARRYSPASRKGTRLGVTGTPELVNGRPVLGAQPIEAFTRVIDEELAKQ
jgi:predicted DsbA family dithiol-disulfide isomerase